MQHPDKIKIEYSFAALDNFHDLLDCFFKGHNMEKHLKYDEATKLACIVSLITRFEKARVVPKTKYLIKIPLCEAAAFAAYYAKGKIPVFNEYDVIQCQELFNAVDKKLA
jgi:hypothetical protein